MNNYFEIPNYEWIPPTDEERVVFANAAKHLRSGGRDLTCTEFCEWTAVYYCYGSSTLDASVAESLSLDGMDISDVSKIEELMR